MRPILCKFQPQRPVTRTTDTRAFRTGDLGRYRADGTILFAGRVNGYIKIRGVRVSLPDIEATLQSHDAIQSLLVLDFGDEKSGEAAIGAVYVPKQGQAISPAILRDYARAHLPASHVPSRFVQVSDIPLSRNGKPDRQRTRALFLIPTQQAPRTISQKVQAIYADILPQGANGAMGETTNFYTLGLRPHHLKLASQKLTEEFGTPITPKHLIPLRNVADIVAFLTKQAAFAEGSRRMTT